MVTWYGKPFDPDDIDERCVRLRLSTLAARRRGALARPSRRSAARFDLTHICVPLWTATSRHLELLSDRHARNGMFQNGRYRSPTRPRPNASVS